MSATRPCWQSALLALAMASTAAAAGGGFAWETDLEAAKATAARTNRLLLVHFGAPWCQPCQQLEREVFSKPGFGNELSPQFVGVKLNYDSFPATAKQYGVQSIPTDVILTPDGKLVERVQSPLSGPEYIAAITRVARIARPGSQGATLASATPTAATGDRYSDNYNPGGPVAAVPPLAAQPQAPAMQPAAAPPASLGALQSAAPQGAAPPGLPTAAFAVPSGPQPPASFAGAPTTPPVGPQLAPGNAPVGLEGFCPVSLCDRQVWVQGDVRWGAQHRGRTYLFAGPDEQQKFMANPDRYSPVMSGDDPVLALDQGKSAPGSRMYGVAYGDHYYLFTTEQSLQAFTQNPKRYAAAAVQARR